MTDETAAPASLVPAAPAWEPRLDGFVHLHTHSGYSILDGLNDPAVLVRRAGHLGQPGLALTDHKRLSGAASFWKAIGDYNAAHAERHDESRCDKAVCHSVAFCRDKDECPKKDKLRALRKSGVDPSAGAIHGALQPMRGILGLETYVAHHGRTTREPRDAGHLVLLAMTDDGWRNLQTLASLASTEGFYGYPRIDMELLERYHEGLIAMSSCLGGHLAERVMEEGPAAGDALIERYHAIFGDRYYLELQWHNDQDVGCRKCGDRAHEAGTVHDRPCERQQYDLNRYLLAASARTGVRLVIANDLHYATRADHLLAEIMLANQQNQTLAQIAAAKAAGKHTIGFDTPDFYLKSRAEMAVALRNWLTLAEREDPDVAAIIREQGRTWLDETVAIAERTALAKPFPGKEPKWPRIDLGGETAEARVERLIWERAPQRYRAMDEKTRRLVAYELQAIEELRYAPYFLIVEDYCSEARRRGIEVGLGRGSAPGSVIPYILGITDADPIKWKLTEKGIGLTRFLNPLAFMYLDAEAFGSLSPEAATLEAPAREEMEAEIGAALRERARARNEAFKAGRGTDIRTGEVFPAGLQAAEGKRWAQLLALSGQEWKLIRGWARNNEKELAKATDKRSPMEALWRWLRHLAMGGAPGDRNDHHSLLALLLGISAAPVTLLDGGELPILPRFSFAHSRVGLPDIDTDFTPRGREVMIRYVIEKYGVDHVAQIATYGVMAAKSAIKDVARAKGLPAIEANRLTSKEFIPDHFEAQKDEEGNDDDTVPGVSLKEMISGTHPSVVEGSKALRALMAQDPRIDEIVKLAARLEGTIRTESTHACGILITPDPVMSYVSVRLVEEKASRKSNAVQAVYDGPTLESFGLIKFDFLGLKNLQVNHDAVDRIRERQGVEVDWRMPPDDDPEALRLLGEGHTVGVFQFSGNLGTKVLRQIKPKRVADLFVATALGRPGPLKYIPDYVEARSKGTASYGEPTFGKLAAPILGETYGILVYQEQVMLLSIDVCGFSNTESDVLRKATAKKDAEKMASIREDFVAGAVAHAVPGDYIGSYWDDVLTPFAAYSFNKSHSCVYGLTAYCQAFLACHYPHEFFSALMGVEQHETKKAPDGGSLLAFAAKGARKRGLVIRPIDINRSTDRIEIEADGGLLMSMVALKGVGRAPIEAVMAERASNGPFAGFRDFLSRCIERERERDANGKLIPNPVNKTVAVALIKVGAFDAFDDRAALLRRAEAYWGTTSVRKRAAIDWSPTPAGQRPARVPLEYFAWEHEALGMYVSGHPIDSADATLREQATNVVADCLAHDTSRDKGIVADGQEKGGPRRVLGVITAVEHKPTRSGKDRYVGWLSDATGACAFEYYPPRLDHDIRGQKAFKAFVEAFKTESLLGDGALFEGLFSFNEEFDANTGPKLKVSGFTPAPLPRLPKEAPVEIVEAPRLEVSLVPDAAATSATLDAVLGPATPPRPAPTAPSQPDEPIPGPGDGGPVPDDLELDWSFGDAPPDALDPAA